MIELFGTGFYVSETAIIVYCVVVELCNVIVYAFRGIIGREGAPLWTFISILPPFNLVLCVILVTMLVIFGCCLLFERIFYK